MDGGSLGQWALCFYHFRRTMLAVPAAAPFASVSACRTTFMELIRPGQALVLYSLFNQWLAALQLLGLSSSFLPPSSLATAAKWQIARLTLGPKLHVLHVRRCNVCYVHSSIPFFYSTLFLLLHACFLCSSLGCLCNFFHMFTA